jgi:imidazolonepropionase-like amidohydrolase
MRPFRVAILCCISSPLVCGQTLSPEVRAFVKVDSPAVALAHVRVIDGTGAPPRDDQTVVITAGKITSLTSADRAAVPAGAKVMDLHGDTVIPGIVGMHEHLFYPTARGSYQEMSFSFPRLYLAAGVTTIRTGGSLEPYTDLEIKRQIDQGKSPGPKMHVTGPYLEGAGTWALQMHQLSGPEDATRTVNYWLDEGADNFKAYNFITSAELAAAITAAHKRGAKVTGHLCSIGFREAAALGIDDLEHGLLVDTEFFPWKKPGECPEEKGKSLDYLAKLDVQSGPVHDMIADLVGRHVAMTSTLPVLEMFVPGRPTIEQRLLDALSADARIMFLANKVRASDAGSIKKRYHSDASPWPAAFKKEMEFERAFVAAGGVLLAGEDPTGMGGVIAGFGDQREIELLVEAGFTPMEAIHFASENAAQYLGENDRIGTLTAGKQADIVVIRGDPSANIADIENVEIVFKDGIGFDSAQLIESVRGVVGTE